MTTGYCEELKRKSFNVKQWLKENAIRAMGVCVTLRDNGDMSEAGIKHHLNSQSSNYHQERLQEARQKLAWTDKQWETNFILEQKSAQERHDQEKIKHTTEQNGFRKARIFLKDSLKKAKTEVEINTLEFAIEQTAIPLRYNSLYKDSILNYTLEEYKIESLKTVDRDLEYHAKEQEKDDERNNKRAKYYTDFCKFVDSLDEQKVKEEK